MSAPTQAAGGGTHLGGALPPPAQTPGSTSPLPGRPTTGEGVVQVGPAGEGGSPPPSPESQHDRIVRLALVAGQRGLRLERVRAVVDNWDENARDRLIVALDGAISA